MAPPAGLRRGQQRHVNSHMRRLVPAAIVLAYLGLAALQLMASREAASLPPTHRLLLK